MLQHALPDVLRKELTDNMFGKFVSAEKFSTLYHDIKERLIDDGEVEE